MDLTPIISAVSEAAVSILSLVVTGLITWAARSLKQFLESKAHFASFNCAMTKLEALSMNAVEEVEQTLVRQFKAEDKWGVETATEARDTAVEIVKKHLGKAGLAEVQGCLSLGLADVERLITTKVEAFVSRSGAGDGPLVPPKA